MLALTGRSRLAVAAALIASLYLITASVPARAQVHARIGELPVVLPVPAEGFTAVPPGESELNGLLDSFVTPANRRLATFVADEQLQAALAGDLQQMPRRFNAETKRTIESELISASDFRRIQEVVEGQMRQQQAELQTHANSNMGTANSALSKVNGASTSISIASLDVKPVHEKSDRSLQMSMVTTFSRQMDGQTDQFTVNASMALVHIGGKILYLYVYGDENDLEWTRDALRQWVSSIEAANDVPASTRSTVSRGGIDWGRVIGAAAVGGLIALFLPLFGLFRRKSGATR